MDSFFIVLKVFGRKIRKNNQKMHACKKRKEIFCPQKIQDKKINHTFAAKYEKSY